jgi:hypothetical protein
MIPSKGGNKMNEIWKPIDGYEGVYEISSLGNVRRIQYFDAASEAHHKSNLFVPMKTYVTKSGYKRIKLSKNGNEKHLVIHRLVAKAFIDNPNKYKIVNHKDLDKLNNSVDNLEWCTQKQNVQHALISLPPNSWNQNKDKAKQVGQYDLDGNLIAIYASAREAERQTNCSQSHISNCCNGKQKKHKGFKWGYI